MRKLILALACAAGTLAVPAVPAMARDNDRIYDRQGRYVQPRAVRANDRVWRGNDGRYYCKRDNGTTGLIIGGAAGALLGREIDGGRERTLGTVLGAAGGALLGREIDRSGAKCR
jgi:uncharacterized protein YcfJ